MSDTDFVSLADVTDRLDWDLDDAELRIAESAIEDASDYARLYGLEWPDPELAPRQLRVLVRTAVVRFMRNPEGYTQSRAGDETVIWAEGEDKGASRGSFAFNSSEIALIKDLAGKGTPFFGSVDLSAWGPMSPQAAGCATSDGYVPTSDTTLFPFYYDGVGLV